MDSLDLAIWELGTENRELFLDSQFLDFIVVVLAIEDGPFLGTFDDGAALAFDFLAGSLIDARFLHEQIFENFSDFETDGIAVFDEVDVIHLSHRVGDGVGEFIDFVAAQAHGSVFLGERG